MKPPSIETLLRRHRVGRLATVDTRGRPAVIPFCFVYDGKVFYSPLDEKPKRSADPHDLGRVQDLLVLPEVTLLVDRWSEDWTQLGWLRAYGRGVILEPEPHEREEHAAAVAALREKYPQYREQALDDRPVIRMAIDRAVSWGNLEL